MQLYTDINASSFITGVTFEKCPTINEICEVFIFIFYNDDRCFKAVKALTKHCIHLYQTDMNLFSPVETLNAQTVIENKSSIIMKMNEN